MGIENGKGKGNGLDTLRTAAQDTMDLPYGLPFREDMSDYENEENGNPDR